MGGALFQFYYAEGLSTSGRAGTLTFTSCKFQHFFYDFTTLIGLTEGHGKVVITDTVFEKFSNCGSIIRDSRNFPIVSRPEHTGTATDGQLRQSRAPIEIIQNDYYVKPTTACSSPTCGSIVIRGCTFTEFNYLKATQTARNKVEATNVMKYQGMIMTLSGFRGSILIKENTFNSLQFKYERCSIAQSTYSEAPQSLWAGLEVYQAKTLFKIDLYGPVEIVGNTFNSCNSATGLIFIKKLSDTTPLLIHANIFRRNSALEIANVIRIDVRTDLAYNRGITTFMPCAGVQISGNTFEKNVGCSTTSGAIVAS